MPIKDHYKTLGTGTDASIADIKKAYRQLAHKYHPDKNPDNAFSATHFREIQEAYHALSDTKRRRAYDEERYFSGLTAQKEPTHINARWILDRTNELIDHMGRIDSYRMNHKALYDYVMILLSDSHLAILDKEKDPGVNRQIIKSMLEGVRKIDFSYFPGIASRLEAIAGPDNEMQQMIYKSQQERKASATLDRIMPLIVVVITLFICLLMYLYSKRK